MLTHRLPLQALADQSALPVQVWTQHGWSRLTTDRPTTAPCLGWPVQGSLRLSALRPPLREGRPDNLHDLVHRSTDLRPRSGTVGADEPCTHPVVVVPRAHDDHQRLHARVRRSRVGSLAHTRTIGAPRHCHVISPSCGAEALHPRLTPRPSQETDPPCRARPALDVLAAPRASGCSRVPGQADWRRSM